MALAEYERTGVIKWWGRSCSGGGQHSHLVSEGSGVGSLAEGTADLLEDIPEVGDVEGVGKMECWAETPACLCMMWRVRRRSLVRSDFGETRINFLGAVGSAASRTRLCRTR